MILNNNSSCLLFIRQIYSLCSIRLASTTSKTIQIVEVGPRDGLQNEKSIIPTDVKVSLVNKLSNAGLTRIEVSSFVSLTRVPQLADATEVFQRIKRLDGIKYTALVPNLAGLAKAILVKPDEIAVFASASETFSKRNINCTIEESLQRFDKVLKLAKSISLPVRGYISCVVGCPYEGPVSADAVAKLSEALWKLGCFEISLGDTIGVGTPESIDKLFSTILDRSGACPREAIAIHCHDTGGLALDNINVALSNYSITVVDTSIGGLGGCPFAGPGVPGNVSTETVVSHFTNKGYTFAGNPKLSELREIGKWISDTIKNSRNSSN